MIVNKNYVLFLMFFVCSGVVYASRVVPEQSPVVVEKSVQQVTAVRTPHSLAYQRYSQDMRSTFTNGLKTVSGSTDSLTTKTDVDSSQEALLTKNSLNLHNQQYISEQKIQKTESNSLMLDDLLVTKVKNKPSMYDSPQQLGSKVHKVAVGTPDSLTASGSSLDFQTETQPIQQVVQQKPQSKNNGEQINFVAREKPTKQLERVDEEQATTQPKLEEKVVEKSTSKSSFLQSIQDFFTRKEDVNAANSNGKVPLQQAIFDHDPSEVKRLLQVGANIDVQDNQGNGLLHMVVNIANSHEKFLKIKQNSHQVDDIQANLDILKILLNTIKTRQLEEKNVSPQKQTIKSKDLLNQKNKLGQTPLHVAIQSVNALAVKELIAAGADVNVIDKNGRTPVMAAVSSELPAYIGVTKNPSQEVLANIIKQLLNARADLTIPDKNGRTVRDEALYQISQYKRLTPEIGDEIHKALYPSTAKKVTPIKSAVPKKSAPTTAPMYKSLSEIQKNSAKTVVIN